MISLIIIRLHFHQQLIFFFKEYVRFLKKFFTISKCLQIQVLLIFLLL